MKKFLSGLLVLTVIGLIIADMASDLESTKKPTNKVSSWWNNYDSQLKSRIDKSTCIELQEEFNIAEKNSSSQRARTGQGNLELMSYIDKLMKSKGCY